MFIFLKAYIYKIINNQAVLNFLFKLILILKSLFIEKKLKIDFSLKFNFKYNIILKRKTFLNCILNLIKF